MGEKALESDRVSHSSSSAHNDLAQNTFLIFKMGIVMPMFRISVMISCEYKYKILTITH